jgi:DNA polymerase III alpha subunit (gram-positive type)
MNETNIPIPPNWRFADSLTLFRKLLPNLGPKQAKPYRLSSLYLHFFQKEMENAHRAEHGVEALAQCLGVAFKTSSREESIERIIKALFAL